MMRNAFLPVRLHLFHRVVEEEVNQNGIDLHSWMLAQYFASDQLDAPDTAASYLDFP